MFPVPRAGVPSIDLGQVHRHGGDHRGISQYLSSADPVFAGTRRVLNTPNPLSLFGSWR